MTDTVTNFAELQAKLTEIKTQEQKVLEEMQGLRQDALDALVEQIRQHIESCNFSLEEVVKDLTPKKGKKGGKRAQAKIRIWVDKVTGIEYSRGPKPAGLSEEMQKMGLDPASKEDWAKFKAERMVEKGGEEPTRLPSAQESSAPELGAELVVDPSMPPPPPPAAVAA